jgi:hypothetical protein
MACLAAVHGMFCCCCQGQGAPQQLGHIHPSAWHHSVDPCWEQAAQQAASPLALAPAGTHQATAWRHTHDVPQLQPNHLRLHICTSDFANLLCALHPEARSQGAVHLAGHQGKTADEDTQAIGVVKTAVVGMVCSFLV